jgi:hypothetical protein
MRSDCRHFFRRTVDRTGDRVEGCAVDAAPDAPFSCPSQCPFFEKRSLSHTGFVYGSLAPDAPAASVDATAPVPSPDAPSDDEAALLAELEQIVSEVAPQELEREQERRRAEDRTRRRRGRKRRD